MEFSPAFSLLIKFTAGLAPRPKSEDEIVMVSNYLGIYLSGSSPDDQSRALTKALSDQNAFLSANLELESIYHSPEYRNSAFVREVVANNRSRRS